MLVWAFISKSETSIAAVQKFCFHYSWFQFTWQMWSEYSSFILFSSLKIEKSVWAYKTPQMKQNTNRMIHFLFQSISKKQLQVYEVSIAEKTIRNSNRNRSAQMFPKLFKVSPHFILGPMNHFRNTAAIV